jgi:KaiC/GvpD/RAD55 family RecA-like ATPase
VNPIKSGILNFDEEFKGFNLGSLVFLGGFPNSGKSILLRSFGANFI